MSSLPLLGVTRLVALWQIYSSSHSPPRAPLMAGPAGSTYNAKTKEFTLHCPDTGLWRLSKDDMDEEIKAPAASHPTPPSRPQASHPNPNPQELKNIVRAERDGTVRVAGMLQEDMSKHQRLAIEATKRAELAEASQKASEAPSRPLAPTLPLPSLSRSQKVRPH